MNFIRKIIMIKSKIITIISFVFVTVVCSQPETIQDTSISAHDSSITARFTNAVLLFNEHDDTGEALIEAQNEFLSILKLNPEHASAIAYLGLIALENQEINKADSLFNHAILIDSTCAEARVGRAQLFRHRMQWSLGYQEARRAVQLSPTSILARWELINELLHRAEAPITDSEIKEAIPHLNKILELDKDDRQAHLDLAESYEKLKRWEEAVHHYREVISIGQLPEDMDVWVYEVHKYVSRCFENLGNFEMAIKELELYMNSLIEMDSDEETLIEVRNKIKKLEQKKKR